MRRGFLALAACVMLAACGTEADTDPTASAPEPTPTESQTLSHTDFLEGQLSDSLVAYYAAIASGHPPAVRDYMSARCSQMFTDDQIRGAAESARAVSGIDVTDVSVRGTRGTISYTVNDQDVLDQAWVLSEDGVSWLYDACD